MTAELLNQGHWMFFHLQRNIFARHHLRCSQPLPSAGL